MVQEVFWYVDDMGYHKLATGSNKHVKKVVKIFREGNDIGSYGVS